MISNDRKEFITLEVFNDRMDRIEKRFIQIEKLIEKSTGELNTAIKLNSNDTAHLQTSVYWGFAIIAFVVTFVGIIPFRTKQKEKDEKVLTESDIRNLIKEELSMAKFIANSGKQVNI